MERLDVHDLQFLEMVQRALNQQQCPRVVALLEEHNEGDRAILRALQEAVDETPGLPSVPLLVVRGRTEPELSRYLQSRYGARSLPALVVIGSRGESLAVIPAKGRADAFRLALTTAAEHLE